MIKRCLAGAYQPLIGTALFLEYEDVMSRETLFAGSPLSKTDRNEVFAGFLAVCRWTEVYFAWRPNLPDEADNHLFELAVAGGAAAALLAFSLSFDDYIITNFNASPSSITFPMYVWGAAQRGTPVEIFVVGTVMFLIALTVVVIGQILSTRRERKA